MQIAQVICLVHLTAVYGMALLVTRHFSLPLICRVHNPESWDTRLPSLMALYHQIELRSQVSFCNRRWSLSTDPAPIPIDVHIRSHSRGLVPWGAHSQAHTCLATAQLWDWNAARDLSYRNCTARQVVELSMWQSKQVVSSTSFRIPAHILHHSLVCIRGRTRLSWKSISCEGDGVMKKPLCRQVQYHLYSILRGSI